ncbi:unnamed protein product, partial [Allacma fusca]
MTWAYRRWGGPRNAKTGNKNCYWDLHVISPKLTLII